ncbi:hypothetical protein PspLS_08461 [Pyricularia sp. CBS 133598]|nr:hypothetical protein PspLS_08461 [Pyricularia sp. CBS 133598]
MHIPTTLFILGASASAVHASAVPLLKSFDFSVTSLPPMSQEPASALEVLRSNGTTPTFVPDSVSASLSSAGSSDGPLAARQGPPAFYACIHPGWTAPCQYFVIGVSTQCYNFLGDWDNSISAFGPDQGTICNLYDSPNCVDSPRTIGSLVWPGISDLAALGWDNAVSSFRCA